MLLSLRNKLEALLNSFQTMRALGCVCICVPSRFGLHPLNRIDSAMDKERGFKVTILRKLPNKE